ncbi:MAG: M48 family peptidase [Bryobacteraceae bacterium]|nr:M48 family peptidase [Bryobacteraceae bacterium]
MQSEKLVETPCEIFHRVFRELRPRTALSAVQVEFRDFAGVTSMIEFRDSSLRVRLSDIFAAAPHAVQEALAHLLLAKLLRRKPANVHLNRYRKFLNSREIVQKAEQMRRSRGGKRVLPPQGQTYNLLTVFEEMNFRFFHGLMPAPGLGWSPSPSRTILGHYDSAHHIIVISRLLDHPTVPKLVVDYVMYHEMLHIRYPTAMSGARRCVHGEDFRRAEAEFPALAQAKKMLEDICRRAAPARSSGPRRRGRRLV